MSARRSRCSSPRLFLLLAFFFLFVSGNTVLLFGAMPPKPEPPKPTPPQGTAPTAPPTIWLQQNRPLTVSHTGNRATVDMLSSGWAQPLALANADFDADGVDDLVVGYAAPGGGILTIHRGNLDAFAPQSQASFEAIGRGDFPDPFLPNARTIPVPVRPDFVAVGSYNGEGYPDIIVAQRGDSSIYLLGNDGKGNFSKPQAINVGGPITTLAAGNFGGSGTYTKLLVGIGDQRGSYLMVYQGTQYGLGGVTVLKMPAPATSIQFGNFGDAGLDAVILAGGKLQILRSSNLRLVSVSLPVSVQAFTLGSFIFDRNSGSQIAVLASDGSVEIAVRNEFDPRLYTTEEFQAIRWARRNKQALPAFVPAASFPSNGWRVVEGFAGVGSVGAGQTSTMFRTRISVNGPDDVMVLNPSGSLVLISHGNAQPGSPTFARGQVSVRSYVGTPIAALPMRVNVDGRLGVVALHRNEVAPSLSMPIPDPTFFVNTDNDPTPTSPIANACTNTSFTDLSSSCSLREAVLKANGDTIMLQAGHTYQLTIGRGATQDYTGNTGALYVNNTATIVGGNQSTTIIQWGTPTPGTATKDMVIAVNEDVAFLSTANGSLSNLTIQGGVNHGTHSNDGDGGCMEFDTGTNGTSTLSLTNVTMQNCATTQGGGGGLVTFAFVKPSGGGTVTISNSLFQNNTAVDSVAGTEGGGIAISAGSVVTMTNTQVKNNTSNHVVSAQSGLGGGIALDASGGTPGAFGSAIIHSSTISGNTAGGLGGGISDLGMSLTIDTGTVISGNTAGAANNGQLDGGGLYLNNHTTDTVTLSKVSITGNSAAGRGGAIHTGNSSAFPSAGPLTMSFSRLAGNTATTAGSNLSNSATSVTATNNWWGTNAPASTISTINSGVTTFDPFIVLTNTASTKIIRINTSTSEVGDMSKDNHGASIGLANLTQIIGQPITFNNAVLGTIPQAQPETLNATATATATFNAGNTAGLGSLDADVDNTAFCSTHTSATNPEVCVGVNSNLIASATESGSTATITTVGAHGYSAGDFVTISGVANSGYNGSFLKVLTTPTSTTFTYTAGASGLPPSSGGKANAGIIILAPPTIAKAFNPTTIQTTLGTGATPKASTITFTLTNGNVIPIDANFTDNLPQNVGLNPGNLVVAATPNVINNCGGSVTATAGASTISFTNANLAAGSCTIKVDVESSVDNLYSNSVTLNSTAAGNSTLATANPSLRVINAPTIAKAFGAATIPLNGTTSLTITLENLNANTTLNGITFTDTLPNAAPGTLVVATPNGLTNNCSGTATAVAGSGSVSLASSSLAPGSSCTVSVNVTGTVAGAAPNSVTASDTTAGAGNTSNATVTVVAPPTVSKAFGAVTIPLNGTTSMVFTVTNPNTGTALTGIAFSDTVPANMKMIGFGSAGDTCSGVTSPGSSTVNYSGISLPANSSCILTVTVKGIAAGDGLNTTSAITSTEGGTGTTSNTATLTVVAPPTISKAFGAANIPLNGTTTVTFTITNPAANTVAETGIAFSDTLTNGLQVASTPGVSNTCGGTVTAAANSTSISLTGGSIATPGSTCTITVNVTGTQSGTVSNTTGAVSSTNGGTGATSNTATLDVVSPATVTKVFGATTIPLNGTTSLTITITNPNTGIALSGVSFTDSLPAGLVVATPNGLTNTCGGTATATAGSGTVSLSGGTLAASASCAVSVNVQGTTAGDKNNSVTVSSTEGGTSTAATATVTVVAPPTISKNFNPLSIPLNGTTTVGFTISNPNNPSTPANGDLTGVAFSDTLPVSSGPGSATLIVAATPNVTNTCGGTVTATAGTGVISLTGGSVAHNSTCTLSVDVTGTVEGDANNTTGAITSTEGGTGTTSNTKTETVVAPPTISKAFGAAAITLNGTTTVTFTITNPASNTTAENGIAFSDTLTNGLQVASTPGVSNTCGGTVTAAANSTSISLTGGSIATPGSTCTIVVNVTGTQSGTVSNTTGAVSSTNGGTGATSNTATLIVASPATVTKVFGATKIPLNGTTSLTINITNPNTNVTLTGLSFTDSLPAGLVVATPNALTNTCGGTATATAGSGTVSLSGGTVASSASCAVSVNVQGTTAGDKNNSVTVSSTEGGASTPATATVTIVAPPTISKAFGAGSIPVNGTTTVTFTISNPNNPSTPTNGDLTGVSFSDTLPVSGGPGSATLVVAGTPGVSNTCGGTVTATAGTGVISLTGGSVAHNSSCTVTVNVTGTVEGDANNTTGAISSTEGGTGVSSNTALLKVVAPPTISKAFGATNISLNGTTTVTFTITNPASNTSAENGIAFSDTLTNGLQVASTPGVSNTCGGTVTAAANSTSISLSGGSIATPGSTCTIVVNVTGTQPGTVTNTTGAVSSTNGGTGATSNTATLFVASPANVTKSFGALSISQGGTTSLTISITNPNTTVPFTGMAFTDSLPAGLVIAPTPNLSNTCGGTATAVAGSGSLSLSGGTLAASGSCAVQVDVQGTTGGVKNNSVVVSTTEGGASPAATASITVVGAPVIIKAFGAASIPLSGSTSLSFTIQNNNATQSLSSVAFSDTLPAGLVVSTPNGLTGSCGAGTITATQGTSVISLAGGTIAANSSCTFSVNVTGVAAGTQNNTTGNVSSAEGGTGGTASASIDVIAPPVIGKAFNPNGIPVNGTSSLTFTITNPAGNTVSELGVAFTDNLPSGVVVATPNGLSNTCGGTPTATAGSGTISLTGGTIATNSSCTVTVNVTSSQAGVYINTSANVSSTNGGTGNTASDTLTVAAPPTIVKAFSATAVAQNGTVAVNFTISNSNTAVTLTGISFTDSLPAGLVVATPNGVTDTCDGTVTAVAGSGSISFSGGDLDPPPPPPIAPIRRRAARGRLRAPTSAGTCVITVNLLVTGTGTLSNTTGPISANESGPGTVSNTATLEVVQAATVNKAFGAASINLGATTSLTFNIANPNSSTPLVNISLNDALPSGLVVANPNGLTGSCVASSSITANAGSGSISLTNLGLPAAGSCSFSVNVTGTTAGVKNNTTAPITATFDDGSGTFVPITGGTASASITVLAPVLAITKTHAGNFMQGQVGASYTITVSNTGTAPTVGTVTVSDPLPASLTPTSVSGTGWTCAAANTAFPCTRSDVLNNGSAYPPITAVVNVSFTAPASVTNTATVSGGGDSASHSASDPTTITPLTITVTATPTSASISAGQSATYNITATSNGNLPGPINLSISGVPPASLFVTSPPSGPAPLSAVLNIFTTAQTAAKGLAPLSRTVETALAMLFAFPLVVLMTPRSRLRKLRRGRWLGMWFVLLLVFGMAACGGGSGFTGGGNHTPPGTYTITITGTSGPISGQTTVTLTVK